jgi:hypothetical protein
MATARRLRDEVAADAAPVPVEGREDAPKVEAEGRSHEDVAQFRGMVSSLGALFDIAEQRRDRRGRYGRRWALVATKLEEAMLQAQQGLREAECGQDG